MKAPATPPCSPFGRPLKYGAADWCDHPLRMLGTFVFSDGSVHVADWCVQCGGRTECISRSDLEAAGIEWETIPAFKDNREAAA